MLTVTKPVVFPSERSVRRIYITYLSAEIILVAIGIALLVAAWYSRSTTDRLFNGGMAVGLIFSLAPSITGLRKRRCAPCLEISATEIRARNPKVPGSAFESVSTDRIVGSTASGRSITLELSDRTAWKISLSTLVSRDRREVARLLNGQIPSATRVFGTGSTKTSPK
jgi:hypothetical protein